MVFGEEGMNFTAASLLAFPQKVTTRRHVRYAFQKCKFAYFAIIFFL